MCIQEYTLLKICIIENMPYVFSLMCIQEYTLLRIRIIAICIIVTQTLINKYIFWKIIFTR